LHDSGLVGGTGANHRPRERSGIHGAFVAALAGRRLSLGLLHAQDERPSGHGGITGGDGVKTTREFVLRAKLKNITLALANTVLASEGTICILLSITIRNLIKKEKIRNLVI
jgi:hypothetical protein